MVTLQVGDSFQQNWKECTKPIRFKVLNVDRKRNSLKVECRSVDGYSHIEEWDDLDVTELAFNTGDYKFI